MTSPQQVLQVLQGVYDPDYRHRSIVDMGLVAEDDISVEGDSVRVNYRLTAPLCPFSAALGLMIKHALEQKLGVKAQVNLEGGHRQAQVVNELLADPERSRELWQTMEDFGLLDICLRLEGDNG